MLRSASNQQMSPAHQELEQFLEWLLQGLQFKNDWELKRNRCRKLQRLKKRVEKEAKAMPPSPGLVQAAALIGKELDEYRSGRIYQVKGKDFHILTMGKPDDEEQRLFVAVQVAGYLYPNRSAYGEVKRRLENHGTYQVQASLAQRMRRFKRRFAASNPMEMINRASTMYGSFLSTKLTAAATIKVTVPYEKFSLLQKIMDRGISAFKNENSNDRQIR
jgi:hypothetical protein